MDAGDRIRSRRRPLIWAGVLTGLLLVGAVHPMAALRDAETLAPVADMRLRVSPSFLALAPVNNTLDALTLLSVQQHIALWLVAACGYALWRWRWRRTPSSASSGRRELALGGLALGCLVVTYGALALAPRPMAALALVARDSDLVVIDFHSHTSASHDGRPRFTAERNREWHAAAGFAAAYISDHFTFAGVAAGARRNPARAGDGTVLLGAIECLDDGEHVVVLGVGAADSGLVENRYLAKHALDSAVAAGRARPVVVQTIPGPLDRVPRTGMTGVVPVAAIELSDAAPRGLGAGDRDRAIIRRLADSLGVAVVAGSDNHGWGRTAAAWSVVTLPGWRALSPDALGRSIERAILERGRRAVRVVERTRPIWASSRGGGGGPGVCGGCGGCGGCGRGRERAQRRRARNLVRDPIPVATDGDSLLARAGRLAGVELGRGPAGVLAAERRALVTGPAKDSMAAAILLVTAGVAARLLMAGVVPLVPDEAYYWEWSRHLAGGYFDHPPAIAWLIRAGTAVAGTTPLGVRLVPVLIGWGGGVAAIALSRRLGDERSAWRAAVLLTGLPLAGIGLVLATPDAALLAGAAITLWAVDHAVQGSGVRGQGSEQSGTWGEVAWWVVAGVSLGVSLISKYTAVLIPAGLAIACAARPSLRAQYRRPGPYVAGLVATLVFLPVIYWNAAHDWVSFRFQLHHGLGSGSGSALSRELALVGGQAGLVSPVLFVLVVAAVVAATARPSVPRRFALATLAAFVWAFFAVSALRHPVEPNWPALAALPAVVLLASWLPTPRRRLWERIGVGVGGALILAVYGHAVHPWLPLPLRADPLAASLRLERSSRCGGAGHDSRRAHHAPLVGRRPISGRGRAGLPPPGASDGLLTQLGGPSQPVRPLAHGARFPALGGCVDRRPRRYARDAGARGAPGFALPHRRAGEGGGHASRRPRCGPPPPLAFSGSHRAPVIAAPIRPSSRLRASSPSS